MSFLGLIAASICCRFDLSDPIPNLSKLYNKAPGLGALCKATDRFE